MSDPRQVDSTTIIVGVDGSPSSKAAAEWASRQATLTNGALELVTTWEIPAMYGIDGEWPVAIDFAGDAARLLHEVVTELLRSRPDVTFDERVVEGHPAPVLIDLSEHRRSWWSEAAALGRSEEWCSDR